MSNKFGNPFDPALFKQMEEANRANKGFLDKIRREAVWAVGDQLEAMQKALIEFGKKGHAGVALLTAARIDDQLQQLLVTQMPALSNALEKFLFRGALSSTEVKASLAQAMGLIDADMRHQIGVVANVRNGFAHSRTELNFESESIIAKVSHFRGRRPGELTWASYARITKTLSIELDEMLKQNRAPTGS